MIRTFVIHPTQTVGSMIAATLTKERSIRVIDQATTPAEALSRLGNGNCDIALISGNFSKKQIKEFVQTLRRNGSQVKTIVTGIADSKTEILDCFAIGAMSYITKETVVENWPSHIHAVKEGRVHIAPDIAAALMLRVHELSKMTVRNQFNPTAFANLTRRESEVLDLIAQDLSNQDIADKLVIGVGTVKNHVHNVLKKLDLNSRKDAKSYLSMVRGSSSAKAATPTPKRQVVYS